MPIYRTPEAAPIADTGVSVDATLPGLRGLAKLADLRPVVVIDEREQAPLRFERLASIVGTLYSGDYSLRNLEHLISIERKSINDLASCCMGENRERFEREILRLRGYRFKRLLIIGTREDIAAGRYHSRINPKSVLATLSAFEIRYDLPIVWAETPEEGARLVENYVWWFSREVVENANNLLRGSKAGNG
jgi:DNA excision repair protein ERCC-4